MLVGKREERNTYDGVEVRADRATEVGAPDSGGLRCHVIVQHSAYLIRRLPNESVANSPSHRHSASVASTLQF